MADDTHRPEKLDSKPASEPASEPDDKLDIRVLVIEDDRFNIKLLTEACRSMGCTVHSALDGLSGVAAFEASPPDLVLLDVMLPGLDGYGVLERIRAHPRGADVPVVMVTALQNDDARIRALELGADDYVHKPFRLGPLRTRIRSVIEMRRFQAALGADLAADRATAAPAADPDADLDLDLDLGLDRGQT